MMKHLQMSYVYAKASSHRPQFMLLVGISFCILFAFVLSACSANGSSGANANTTRTTTTTTVARTSPAATTSFSSEATTTNYPIKVFFSKYPTSVTSDPTAVYPVDRISPTLAVATYSIQLLIAGPTLDEQKAGYFTELNTLLSGPSKCSGPLPVGGPDFTVALDKKGSVTQKGTATLQFCRSTTSPGIGADARVKAEIDATLKQFSTIKNVVILTQSGHCFGDESGMDQCLK